MPLSQFLDILSCLFHPFFPLYISVLEVPINIYSNSLILFLGMSSLLMKPPKALISVIVFFISSNSFKLFLRVSNPLLRLFFCSYVLSIVPTRSFRILITDVLKNFLCDNSVSEFSSGTAVYWNFLSFGMPCNFWLKVWDMMYWEKETVANGPLVMWW